MKTKTALHLFASTIILLLFVSCGPSERKQLEKEGWKRYGEVNPTHYYDDGTKTKYVEFSIYYKTDIINGAKYIAVKTHDITTQPSIKDWWHRVYYGESITRHPLIEGPFLVHGDVYGWKFASGETYLNFD